MRSCLSTYITTCCIRMIGCQKSVFLKIFVLVVVKPLEMNIILDKYDKGVPKS